MRKLTSKAPTRGYGAAEFGCAGSLAKYAAATAESEERNDGGGGGGGRRVLGVEESLGLPDHGLVTWKDGAEIFRGELVAPALLFTLNITVHLSELLRACRPACKRSAADWYAALVPRKNVEGRAAVHTSRCTCSHRGVSCCEVSPWCVGESASMITNAPSLAGVSRGFLYK